MSAYMPVKHSWSLEALLPSRWGIVRMLRYLCLGVVIAATVVLTIIAISGFGRVGIDELPSASSGSVASLGTRIARDHGFIIVQGEARNRGERTLRNLEATVELFDRNGTLRTVESALVESPSIAAREESAFVLRMPDPGGVRSFRVRFHSLSGGPAR